jgi:hypothetical protein
LQITEAPIDGKETNSPEEFDEEAEDIGEGWAFPDPATLDTGTPLPLIRTQGQQLRLLEALATPNQARRGETEMAAAAIAAPDPSPATPTTDLPGQDPPPGGQPSVVETTKSNTLPSALAMASQQNTAIKTPHDLMTFLQWQESCHTELEEQKRFREDALGYPHLLVFAAMQKSHHTSISFTPRGSTQTSWGLTAIGAARAWFPGALYYSGHSAGH